jgi:hypothetical protein
MVPDGKSSSNEGMSVAKLIPPHRTGSGRSNYATARQRGRLIISLLGNDRRTDIAAAGLRRAPQSAFVLRPRGLRH